MTVRHRHTETRGGAKARRRLGTLAMLALAVVSSIAVWVYFLPRSGTPERLARDYLALLVTAPSALAEDETLARAAGGAPPESLLERLAVRVAVESLRARHAQGAELRFRIGEVHETATDRRSVLLEVEVREGNAVPFVAERFVVGLARDAAGDWRLTGITEAD